MLKWFRNQKSSSLLGMLSCLTLLFVGGQLSFFIIHYKVTSLIDSLVKVSILLQLMHPVVLVPLLLFITLQVLAYVLLIAWVGWMATAMGEWWRFSKTTTLWIGIALWATACLAIVALNYTFFPDSFFSQPLAQWTLFKRYHAVVTDVSVSVLIIASIQAFIYCVWTLRYRKLTSLMAFCVLSVMAAHLYGKWAGQPRGNETEVASSMPNIILIGLDSMRPDFTSFYNKKAFPTPNIDAFLRESVSFTEAYSPLARTFPSWVSILTAKYPKHHSARNNLVDPTDIVTQDTLAKRLQKAGYETVYATDEKRFSNITSGYGFDRVLGPHMGVNDFLLGGLSDFPLTNLLINLPIGEWLFPYNYGNRAAVITYQPNTFINLLNQGLAQRSGKPLFLSVHLCLSHWPFTWARDGMTNDHYMPDQYRNSVKGVDQQLGEVMQILQAQGLLTNSLVVLLSDHGTALGLPGDRIIAKDHYLGKPEGLQNIPVNPLSNAPSFTTNFRRDYTINTSYGQGTNVLSLTQSHVLLAFRGFGTTLPVHEQRQLTSLIDIAPTLLDYLHLAPLEGADGESLFSSITEASTKDEKPRVLFMETGDSMTEIETDHIYIEKVIKHEIGVYSVNPVTGLMYMNPPAQDSIIRNKQLAIMTQDWLLAHFPAHLESRFVPKKGKNHKIEMIVKRTVVPPYYVLVNLKTGQWAVDLTSPFAKASPVESLHQQLLAFYGEELARKEKA